MTFDSLWLSIMYITIWHYISYIQYWEKHEKIYYLFLCIAKITCIVIWNYFIKYRQTLTLLRSSPPRGVLRKMCPENMQQIYWRTPIPKFGFNKVAKQLYWNKILVWVFPCEFAACFQNIFSYEHLQRAASDCCRITIATLK